MRIIKEKAAQFVENCPVGTSFDLYTFRIPTSQLMAAKSLDFREIVSRSAEECRDVVAPKDGTPESERVGVSDRTIAMMPRDTTGFPKGQPIRVTVHVTRDGIADSAWSNMDATLVTNLTRFLHAWKGKTVEPLIYYGCVVPGTFSYTVVR